MSNIEVGEYIRTKNGNIGKLNRIIEEKEKVVEETLYELHLQKNEYYLATFNEIIKHSKNIIDLIEVGDHVNGHRIYLFIYDGDGNKIKLIAQEWGNPEIDKDEIKSIVTKEQFEGMEYRIC